MDEAPKILYRYKYLKFDEGSLRIITDGTLKFTCPLEFNDPFDSLPVYDESSISEIYRLRPDLIKLVAKQKNMSPSKRIFNKGKFTKNFERVVRSGDFAKGIYSTVGIFCLSRTPTNPLMWAHYADNHKGLVVEFKISLEGTLDPKVYRRILPHKVNYTDVRPILDVVRAPDQKADIESYFLTKSLDWQYEQEERVIDIDGPGIYEYSRFDFLESIIVGARMPNEDIEKLKVILNQVSAELGKAIPLRKAEFSPLRYEITIAD